MRTGFKFVEGPVMRHCACGAKDVARPGDTAEHHRTFYENHAACRDVAVIANSHDSMTVLDLRVGISLITWAIEISPRRWRLRYTAPGQEGEDLTIGSRSKAETVLRIIGYAYAEGWARS
ncbi:hypothetical protein [Mycobacteroides abscessus]|uniref:hypothetical protein n=1 Tax=Mycobacteroides abscessus TaxID=36809 RepID=UPI00148FF14E|nr:hypothetical protein [Mycobacteroides abscessus]